MFALNFKVDQLRIVGYAHYVFSQVSVALLYPQLKKLITQVLL